MRILALALVPSLVLPSCMGTMKSSTRLHQVDGLVSNVENVQVECEVTRESIRSSVASMLALVAPKEGADVRVAFTDFEAAIVESVAQEKNVNKAFTRLEKSAQGFFEGWEADLETFTSQEMSKASRTRMEDTRAMYDAVMLSSADPLQRFAAFNTALGDVALFLSRDFNPTSVQLIENELRNLIREAGEIQRQLDFCAESAAEYVQEAGLPMRVQVDESTETTATE